MSEKAPQSSVNSGINVIHSIYYYVVIAACVLTISISSFILLRRILIDTALPQLRQDDTYYYSPVTRDSLRYSYPECDPESSKYDSDNCDKLVDKMKADDDSKRNDRYNQIQAEQYVYSILAIVIASIVAAIHIVFFRPVKK